MLVAIQTKYLGPTNHRGSRVKAIARRRDTGAFPMRELALTDSWDHGSNAEDNHARVAKLLAVQSGWSGTFVGGALDGSGYVFVNIGRAALATSYLTRDRDYFMVEQS